MEMFMVGGAVRDKLLGVKSKDIDFSVVINEGEALFAQATGQTPFQFMVNNLIRGGFKIFLESPEFLTARAQFPKDHEDAGLTADFVLARKESDYTDNRRPDRVEPGTLMDDLARRDFTVNAIAKSFDGELIDPFGGAADLEMGLLRAVGDPEKRFEEDALRILRGMRFAVTKGFTLEQNTDDAMWRLRKTVAGVSPERVREELTKMFNHSPEETINMLDSFDMFGIIFGMGINFQPTMKERIR